MLEVFGLMNLQEARLSKKVSQIELGATVGLGQASISLYESGFRLPSPETRRRIEQILNAEGLIDWEEDDQKS